MIALQDIGWLAGLLEGEAYFALDDGRHGAQIQVKSVDEDVLRRIVRVIGVGRVYGPHGPYVGNKQAHYRWNVTKQIDVRAVLMTIYPFMCERRQRRIRQILTG